VLAALLGAGLLTGLLTGVVRGAVHGVLAAGLTSGAASQLPPGPVAALTYAEARLAFQAAGDLIPADLRGKTPAELAQLWPAWAARRDREIRDRLVRGDEDSIVNLWLFGTSFTDLPPARDRDMAAAAPHLTPSEIVEGRLADLVAAIRAPGSNERVRFAREVIERHGMDPDAAAQTDRVRGYLIDLRSRALDEFRRRDRELASAKPDAADQLAAHSTIFRDRGLSTDTSMLPAYGIDQALQALRREGQLPSGGVHRAAIVGPGLDFTNKADGFDFYPQQTIEPFALVDSLRRLGLAAPDLRLVTFDLSPRVNHHLESARQRARAGGGYLIHLPRDTGERWDPGVLGYWQRFGATIGMPAVPSARPAPIHSVEVRAVRVRSGVVLSIQPIDLDIVIQRLEPLPRGEQFDLVIATNIFVYYDVFEQALAVSNIASMLAPGGLLVSNDAVLPVQPLRPSAGYTTVVYSDRQIDRMLWYRKEGERQAAPP
jgi:hypothetical protein